MSDVSIKYNSDGTTITISHESISVNLETSNGLDGFTVFNANHSVLSDHLMRLLVKNNMAFVHYSNADLFREFIKKKMSNIYSYCTFCGNSIENVGKISHCSSEQCRSKIYTHVTDNIVTD